MWNLQQQLLYLQQQKLNLTFKTWKVRDDIVLYIIADAD